METVRRGIPCGEKERNWEGDLRAKGARSGGVSIHLIFGVIRGGGKGWGSNGVDPPIPSRARWF